MALAEVKTELRQVPVIDSMSLSWRSTWHKLEAKLGIEVFVPDFPDKKGLEERTKSGYKVIYLPREVSGPDAVPALGKALGFIYEADFFKQKFTNETTHHGWRYVYGNPETPLLGLSEEDQKTNIHKIGGEGVTVNEEFILYLLLGGALDRGTFVRILSTKINDGDLSMSFARGGLPSIARGSGWPKQGVAYVGARWSVPCPQP